MVVNDQLFMQGGADTHRKTALNLRDAIERVDRLTHVMSRNHSDDAHSSCFFIDGDLRSLRRIHIERGCVLAVPGLWVDVFTEFVGIGRISTNDTILSKLRPNDLSDSHRLARVFFQKYLAVREAKIL